jgi:hypothetical protein
LSLPDGEQIPLKARSLAGLIPLVAAMVIELSALDTMPVLHAHLTALANEIADLEPNGNGCILLSVVPQPQIKHLLDVLFDPKEFLSPYGLRSLSKVHAEQPVKLELEGKTFELEYVPGNSKDKMFGGNSNWRGPIWAPLNHVLIEALYVYDDFFQMDLIRHEDKCISLKEAAHLLIQRLTSIFKKNQNEHRPYLGDNPILQADTNWHQAFWFHEYFDPETGEGLGASHQNGWTAFIACLIQNQGQGKLYLKQK